MDALTTHHNVLATDEMALALLHAQSWWLWTKSLLDSNS